jgi:hypothetical protein
LIGVLTQSGELQSDIEVLARDFWRAGHGAMPADFATLCAVVEEVEGVSFRELVERLATGLTNGDELLKKVVAVATEVMKKIADDSAPRTDAET